MNWKLIYSCDPLALLSLFESDGDTMTNHTVEVFDTEEEAKERAVELGFQYLPDGSPIVLKSWSVPDTITNWRAKAVLTLHGLLGAVESALDSLPEPDRTVALAAWNGNADFVRNGPTVLALAQILSLTGDQLDAMFIQAAALEV